MGTVLVTGATGLVGSNLCKTLVQKGYKVRALVRDTSNKDFLDTLNIEYLCADLRDFEKLQDGLKDIEIVFHCAAQVKLLDAFDHEHASTNIQGTRNLLQASLTHSIKRFVYVSTLGVLGVLKDHYNDKEDSPYVKVGNPYYDTKIDAERLVLNYYNDKNFPAVIIRPGFIYGPGDRNGLPNLMPFILRRMVMMVGSGNNDIGLTGIGNLVDALILASEVEGVEGKIFNITDDQGVTANQFLKEICNNLNLPEAKIHLPTTLMSNIAKTFDGINRLLEREAWLNEYTVAMICNNHHFDITKARKELGYSPKYNFEANLKEAVEWYMQHYDKDVKEAEHSVKVAKATLAGALFALTSLTALLIKSKSNKKI